MKKLLGLMVLVLLGSWYLIASDQDMTCEQKYRKAKELAEQGNYQQAYRLYSSAKMEFMRKGNVALSDACRIGMYQAEKVLMEHPYNEDEAVKMLEDHFPDVPKDARDAWIKENKVISRVIDGQKKYSENLVDNIKFRNIDLMRKDASFIAVEKGFFNKYDDIVFRDADSGYPESSWQPYTNPVDYVINMSLDIPRHKLPGSGMLQLWLPLPINTSAQDDVRIVSVEPEKYVKYPPSINSEIGLVYLAVPLADLKDDLSVKVQCLFKHYEQHFEVDPKLIGSYDTNSSLYRKYTRSYGNTEITQDIKKKAREIVMGEKNPYLAAKKLYDYVVDNISYSIMPHLSLDVVKKSESTFVHENMFGDCGSQSMYFVALCRSIGIPARTAGGWQLCPEYESCHFWAEFYLPHYGWLPVDISLGQISKYPPELTNEQRQTFKDFFFGHQDPYRWVIQKDVDVALIPEADEPILLSMAIQYPAVICKTSADNLAYTVVEHWKLDIHPIYE